MYMYIIPQSEYCLDPSTAMPTEHQVALKCCKVSEESTPRRSHLVVLFCWIRAQPNKCKFPNEALGCLSPEYVGD